MAKWSSTASVFDDDDVVVPRDESVQLVYEPVEPLFYCMFSAEEILALNECSEWEEAQKHMCDVLDRTGDDRATGYKALVKKDWGKKCFGRIIAYYGLEPKLVYEAVRRAESGEARPQPSGSEDG